MKTPLLMAAIAAGLTLAATAEAREGRDARMAFPTFEELDLDTDGGVTMEEVQAGLQAAGQARFAEIDTNGDGGLSASNALPLMICESCVVPYPECRRVRRGGGAHPRARTQQALNQPRRATKPSRGAPCDGRLMWILA